MAVGAAFDAYVKSHLYGKILPNGPLADQFDFEKIFESQVEPHNRDFGREAGGEVFELYKKSGALADLTYELERGQSEPRFEFTLRGEVGGVTLLGKPDVWFVNKMNQPIILDWKVNGYCSERGRSPSKGYVRLRDESGNLGKSHRDAVIFKEYGILINSAYGLEEVDKSWATQISTYAWLCGAEVGSSFVSAIDQIFRNTKGKLSVAEHRTRISAPFQLDILRDYAMLWEVIRSGWIFRDSTEEESRARQEALDNTYKAYEDETGAADFLKELKSSDQSSGWFK